MIGIFDRDLARTAANHVALTPLTFLEHTARTYPDRISVIHGERTFTWRQTAERCRRLASALIACGVEKGDTVAVLAPNVPAQLEAHFGVALAGAVLNTINTRLDAGTIAFILEHAEAKALIVDEELAGVARKALEICARRPLVIGISDPQVEPAAPIGGVDYEAFIGAADPKFRGVLPQDEWQAISLNYTSGTTGTPKGVVYHHRGAYLTALGNALAWGMAPHPVYLWTVPMFHCNGWCFPWTVTALAGTHVCLRKVDPASVFAAIESHRVTHFGGAPTVLNMLLNAEAGLKRKLRPGLKVMTAGAAPPAAVIAGMEQLGVSVTHVYGLTETYGPATVCAWHEEWNSLPLDERAALKARQGVAYVVLDSLSVRDPNTMQNVPADGATLGEVMFRGNVVMKGYLKEPAATADALREGWFHSGDLGVMHPDGYIELKDRSKDIIISGGENISTIEVETVLYRHPAVLEAAVVGRPDVHWGETPCAFVTLKSDALADEAGIIQFCREHLAHFKVPKAVIFGPLPKTSTGKVEKYVLRSRATGREVPSTGDRD